jgi:nitrogen fixation protein FixH
MKKGMGWPIGVVVILAATVAGNIGVIVLTKDDPSFAIEPDYYRKAVAWDSTQARIAQSNALAWTVSAAVSDNSVGENVLTLQLLDHTGAAVQDARLTGTLLHVARANEVQSVVFAETPDGRYAATVPMDRRGMWELRLAAVRNAEQFQQTVRIDTDRANTPPPNGP